jgi:hypothetical protein
MLPPDFVSTATFAALLEETPTDETASASPRPIMAFLNSPLFVDV